MENKKKRKMHEYKEEKLEEIRRNNNVQENTNYSSLSIRIINSVSKKNDKKITLHYIESRRQEKHNGMADGNQSVPRKKKQDILQTTFRYKKESQDSHNKDKEEENHNTCVKENSSSLQSEIEHNAKSPEKCTKELFDEQIENNLAMIDKYIKERCHKEHNEYARIYADRSKIHGIGIFAGEDIKPGVKIIEYVGEIIGKKVADKREKRYKQNAILSIYLFKIFEDLIIDATLKGNLARFINHSCRPNAKARIIGNRIFIYSLEEIKAREEVTFYYNFSSDENNNTKVPCYCGHELCTKFIV